MRCGLSPERVTDLGKLEVFYADLLTANQDTNLTRITAPQEFWLKHVADSLAAALALPALVNQPWRVADVGSGAGFPLIPLAWANPAARFTGIEVNHKKLAYLQHAIDKLGLTNCELLGCQAREAGRLPEHQGLYDAVLSRAVGSPATLVRDCRQLLKPQPGARIVLYTTPTGVEGARALAAREAAKFDLTVVDSAAISLPEDAGSRQFLMFVRP